MFSQSTDPPPEHWPRQRSVSRAFVDVRGSSGSQRGAPYNLSPTPATQIPVPRTQIPIVRDGLKFGNSKLQFDSPPPV